MKTLATRRQSFLEGAVRASEFWLMYVQRHRQEPQALSAEQDNILQAIAACQVCDAAWQVAADLALQFHYHMEYSGLWVLWEHCLTRLLELKGRNAGMLTEALLHHWLAYIQGRQGRWAESAQRAERSVAMFRQVGDAQSLARGLVDLGQWTIRLERWRETEQLAQEARDLVGLDGDRSILADAFILQGRGSLGQGQFAKAISYFESALEVADEPRYKAATNFLGQAYLQQGRPDEALPHFRKALKVATEEGDRPGQGVILGNIGTVHLRMNRFELALSYLEESLTITRETDNRPAQAVILLRLGQIHVALEQQGRSLRYFDQALDIAQEAGDQARAAEIQEAIAAACAPRPELAQVANEPRTWRLVPEAGRDKSAGNLIP